MLIHTKFGYKHLSTRADASLSRIKMKEKVDKMRLIMDKEDGMRKMIEKEGAPVLAHIQ